MGKLWERYINEEGKSRIREIAPETLRIAEPTLIVLPGFLTLDKTPAKTSGSIKVMQQLLAEQNPKVYGWSHGGLRNLFNIAAYNSFPSYRHSKAGDDLARAVILPLVTNAEGKPLPQDEARKNLRNVTFFGYSAGSIVGQETFNAARKMMQKAGYSKTDATDILHEVVLVSVGAVSRFEKEKDRFTALYLVATNDRLMRAKNWLWGPLGTALRTAFTRYGLNSKKEPLVLHSISKTSMLVTAPAQRKLYEDPAVKPLYPKWTLRHSYHEMQHYITNDESQNAFANIARNALANALTRKKRLTPEQLVKARTPSRPYDEKIAYALRDNPYSLEF